MSRYLVIGCGGSGKSTMASRIASICNIPYIDTDSLYWSEGWSLRTDEDVVSKLPLASAAWAIDGNFVAHREQVWKRAESIIWLNLPSSTILFRITKRNLGWWITRKSTWSGNRIPLSRAISGIRHTFGQLRRFKYEFPKFLLENEDKNIYILRSVEECSALLNTLKTKANKSIEEQPIQPPRD